MSFGEKLQQLRKEKGLSQEDLAHQLNVSRQAVSKWESQNGYPEMEKIIIISELFQVSLDYLMKEDYEKQETEPTTSFYLMTQQKIEDYLHMKKVLPYVSVVL
ncbi:helix-turn-helix domain-containing protein [Allocoprobacillus halotolerans]|uniref:Helix-turn-helix domain-containing protein n=1 Tax=Allocoprobacillus halotolerans TaxID=2944914 RepID=A0ABY5I3Y9_9FIRM|nr:helix-turn-helix transcriptional regulator [Allocoprobacillus halotolerans]UTY40069.1 helix-turn-helix domain-containing protein [Allocoprobacillus halotolerans]